MNTMKIALSIIVVSLLVTSTIASSSTSVSRSTKYDHLIGTEKALREYAIKNIGTCAGLKALENANYYMSLIHDTDNIGVLFDYDCDYKIRPVKMMDHPDYAKHEFEKKKLFILYDITLVVSFFTTVAVIGVAVVVMSFVAMIFTKTRKN